MTNVVPMRPVCRYGHTADEAHAILVGLAEDDARVLPTQHAFQRMDEREITFTQVLRVLRRGTLFEPASLTPENTWSFQLRALSAGQDVSVVATLDQDRMGNVVVVITVIAH